jgi:hypothetical protein
MNTMSQPTTPLPTSLTGLALAGNGALIGAVFPVAALFLTSDIGGGLSVSADTRAFNPAI